MKNNAYLLNKMLFMQCVNYPKKYIYVGLDKFILGTTMETVDVKIVNLSEDIQWVLNNK